MFIFMTIYYSLTVNDMPAIDGNFTIHLIFTKIKSIFEISAALDHVTHQENETQRA